VAVAADMCDVSLGSDTGGSIRQPSAFCGVTGLKPTYGSVSRYGLIAMASSLDVIGPMARSAEQVEQVFSVISGKDENDQTTIDYKYEKIDQDLSLLKVGLPKELWDLEKVDSDIKQKVQDFVDWLKSKGAEIKEVSLPSVLYAVPAYYIIVPAEVMANVERFDGIRYQKSVASKNLLEQYKNTRALFGPEVKRRILLGTYVLSVGHYDDYYQLAVKARQQITREYENVLSDVDMIVSPVTPMLPYRIGSQINDPLAMYQADLLTIQANLTGTPALSMPVGFSQDNLPIGAQLMSAKKRDNLLLSVAKQYQKETNYHQRKAQV
jgi:aspartyl-tRNA(Asn)/glutamyl-tRNA(Gln) amidotransferase subunit A